jgi:biofilm protein TabA
VIAGTLDGPLTPVAAWPAVLELLRRAGDRSLLDAPPGRYDLDGERLFFTLSDYDTRPVTASLPESHREDVDVQVVLRGEERMGWAPLSAAWRPRGAYDARRDLLFHEGGEGLSWLHAIPGRWFLFAPGDLHQPCIEVAGPAPVRKLVGKVHRSLLGIAPG